jgi:hypothetical protein
MSTARKVLQEALELDEHERAALALSLLDSISQPDERDEEAWLDEIERRAHLAVSGAEAGIDADDAVDAVTRELGL